MDTVYVRSNTTNDGHAVVRSQVVPDEESDISIDESVDSDFSNENKSRPLDTM